MLRRVQAVNAARQEFNIYGTDTYFPSRRVEDFVKGVKWADQNPINYDGKAMLYVLNKGHEQGWKDAIDKAVEWIKQFAYNSVVTDHIGEREKQAIIITFKEAMEEENKESP